MRRIAVLDAPSNLGLRPPTASSVPGCAKAPGALRDHALLTRLGARDAGCVTPARFDPAGWEPGDGVAQSEDLAIFTRRLADRIGSIIDAGDFPVVLGGDCSILLGAGLAMRRHGAGVGGRVGLVYVDGHSDFRHQGNASYVGAAGGEALALATGRGQANLAGIENRRPYFRDLDVVLLGIRTHDEYRLDLQAAGILARPVPELRSEGAPKSAQWARQHLGDCVGYWVHVDVDVLDPAVMPAVDAPDAGGIAYTELEQLLATLVDTPRCLGVQVTVFDPDYDPEAVYAREVADTLVAGLSPLTLAYEASTRTPFPLRELPVVPRDPGVPAPRPAPSPRAPAESTYPTSRPVSPAPHRGEPAEPSLVATDPRDTAPPTRPQDTPSTWHPGTAPKSTAPVSASDTPRPQADTNAPWHQDGVDASRHGDGVGVSRHGDGVDALRQGESVGVSRHRDGFGVSWTRGDAGASWSQDDADAWRHQDEVDASGAHDDVDASRRQDSVDAWRHQDDADASRRQGGVGISWPRDDADVSWSRAGVDASWPQDGVDSAMRADDGADAVSDARETMDGPTRPREGAGELPRARDGADDSVWARDGLAGSTPARGGAGGLARSRDGEGAGGSARSHDGEGAGGLARSRDGESAGGSARSRNGDGGSARSRDAEGGLARPRDTEGGLAPARDGTGALARPHDREGGLARSRDGAGAVVRPRDGIALPSDDAEDSVRAYEGDSALARPHDGFTLPGDTKGGLARPHDAEGGSALPGDAEGGSTPVRDGEGGLTRARDGEGGSTSAHDGAGSLARPRAAEGSLTPARDAESGLTPARDGEGGLTPARDGEGGLTSARDGVGGLARSRDGESEGGLARSRAGDAGVQARDGAGRLARSPDENGRSVWAAHDGVGGSAWARDGVRGASWGRDRAGGLARAREGSGDFGSAGGEVELEDGRPARVRDGVGGPARGPEESAERGRQDVVDVRPGRLGRRHDVVAGAGAPTEFENPDDSFAVDAAFVPQGAGEVDPAEDAPFDVHTDDENQNVVHDAGPERVDPAGVDEELVEFAEPEDMYLADVVPDEDMFLADSVTAPALGVAVEGGSVDGDRDGDLPVDELMGKRLTG